MQTDSQTVQDQIPGIQEESNEVLPKERGLRMGVPRCYR